MTSGAERTHESSTRSDRRTLLWTLGSILVLALVMYATAALSSPKDADRSGRGAPVQTSDSDTAAEASERLYQQALEAQRGGETTRALELANKAVEADAGNTRAMRLTVELSGATGSAPSGSGGSDGESASGAESPSGTATPVAGGAPAQPRVDDIESLLPKSVSGFAFGIVQAVSTDAVCSAEPGSAAAGSATVTRALFSVHDRETEKAARQWVDTMGKRVYPMGASRVTIAGGPGLFGTDGTRLAWASFARGPYAFEVLVTVSGDPDSARSATLKLAETFNVKH